MDFLAIPEFRLLAILIVGGVTVAMCLRVIGIEIENGIRRIQLFRDVQDLQRSQEARFDRLTADGDVIPVDGAVVAEVVGEEIVDSIDPDEPEPVVEPAAAA